MNEEELKKRLLAAFRSESAERMRVLSSDFLRLEKGAPEDEALKLIESSYRELHSLKGASRAVGLGSLEKFCQAFESFFSAFKKKRAIPSKHVCSVMLGWLDILEDLMAGEDESESALSGPAVAVAMSRMQDMAEGRDSGNDVPEYVPEEQTGATVVSETVPPAGILEKGGNRAAVQTGPAKGKGLPEKVVPVEMRAARNDYVRLSSSFITGLLLRSEDLISVKNAQAERVRDIRDLEKVFADYRTAFQDILGDGRQGADEEQVSAYADADKKLDAFARRLSQLAATTRKAQWELGSKVDSLLADFKSSMLLPFSSLLEMFPRMVRSLAAEQGKKCELEISGENVRIDRRILDILNDPLMHMVRNSIDHGIESIHERVEAGKPEAGKIMFSVTQTDRDVVKIVYGDDGRGVSYAKLREKAVKQGFFSADEVEGMDRRSILELVFVSGMSTSEIITDISGRGLGMSIVRDKIESVGGSVVVASPEGKGIRIVINIPVALTSFRGIVAEAGGRSFVVPKSVVRKVLLIRQEDIGTAGGRETIVFSGRPVPLVGLADILELDSGETERKSFPVFIMGKGRKTVAISLEGLCGEEDVMAKTMGPMLKRVRNISGISMLGSGELAPILHGPDMIRTALGVGSGLRTHSFSHLAGKKEKKTVLIAEDSITSRMLLKNVLEAAGYNVRTAVDGRDALSSIKQELPDILVSDVEMPHMDGFTLTASIRKMPQAASLPIVLVTSLGSQEDRKRGVESGADAYIIKSSFDQGSLLDVVSRLIG